MSVTEGGRTETTVPNFRWLHICNSNANVIIKDMHIKVFIIYSIPKCMMHTFEDLDTIQGRQS